MTLCITWSQLPTQPLRKSKKLLYSLEMVFSSETGIKVSKLSLFFLFSLIVLFFTACAHKEQKICQELDWYEIGRQDGASVKENKSRRPIAAVCEDSDQSLSEALYNNGFDSSIATRCTQKNGFALGIANEPPKANLCPPLLHDEFLASYKQGQRYREIQNEKNNIQSKISNIESALKNSSLELAKRGLMSGEKIELLEKVSKLGSELEQIDKVHIQN